ncbi:hypothetical protein ACFQFH_18050 [Halobaculum halobium]|uniref:hypothetical protein n=1 Tax=Halobaculum halobium TaxID=3032281 RepID=UPI00361C0CC5
MITVGSLVAGSLVVGLGLLTVFVGFPEGAFVPVVVVAHGRLLPRARSTVARRGGARAACAVLDRSLIVTSETGRGHECSPAYPRSCALT